MFNPDNNYEEASIVYSSAVTDLAFIIAQMTAGYMGVLPEQEDFEIAEQLSLTAREMIDEYYDT